MNLPPLFSNYLPARHRYFKLSILHIKPNIIGVMYVSGESAGPCVSIDTRNSSQKPGAMGPSAYLIHAYSVNSTPPVPAPIDGWSGSVLISNGKVNSASRKSTLNWRKDTPSAPFSRASTSPLDNNSIDLHANTVQMEQQKRDDFSIIPSSGD